MNENIFKLVISLFLVFFLVNFMCSRKPKPRYGDVKVQTTVTAADGLDLKAEANW